MRNMRRKKDFLQWLDANLERWSLLYCYLLLVVTMIIEVIRRELFQYSSVWGEEMVRYAFIYLTWIGAASVIRDRAHIRIDVLFHFLNPRGRAWLYVFGDAVMLLLGVLVLILSLESVQTAWQFGSVSHGLRLPMAWFLLAVPLGFLLMVYRLLRSLYQDLSDVFRGRDLRPSNRLFD